MKQTKSTKKDKPVKEQQLFFIGVDPAAAYEQYVSLMSVGFTKDQAFELTKQVVKDTYTV